MSGTAGRRRVAVTGLGVVSPLGDGVDTNWEGLLAGRSGIRRLTRFECDDYPCQIGGEADFDPSAYLEKKELRRMDRFIQFAMAGAAQAMGQSGLPVDDENTDRIGCIVGVGIGGLQTIEDTHDSFMESRLKRLSPFFIPKLISNLAPGHISMRYGLRGVNMLRRARVRREPTASAKPFDRFAMDISMRPSAAAPRQRSPVWVRQGLRS